MIPVIWNVQNRQIYRQKMINGYLEVDRGKWLCGMKCDWWNRGFFLKHVDICTNLAILKPSELYTLKDLIESEWHFNEVIKYANLNVSYM